MRERVGLPLDLDVCSPQMDLHQLRTFVVVAREGSITRASELLHLSQPAVSAHIRPAPIWNARTVSATLMISSTGSTASLGASGAIFGLFGATAVLMRRLNQDMRPIVALLVINVIITFGWSNIAWQAHLGGFVAGVVIGYAMVHAPRERRALVQYGTCALALAVVVLMTLLRTAQLT